MTNVVSHDTESMRQWSTAVDEHSNSYDDLISRLYAIVDEFVGSPEFKGGLSDDFFNTVISQRNNFIQYSDTFKECAKLISTRAGNIDSDEAQLKSMINNANPLG